MESLGNFLVFFGIGAAIRYGLILPLWRKYKAERAEAMVQAVLRAQASDEEQIKG